MSKKEQEEQIDPAVYQYDQIYDQIKGNHQQDKHRERSRSRDNKKQYEKPKQSKYINKMKQIVSGRQKDHQIAYQRKIKMQNQKLGVSEDMVFVTESFLKKKEEQRQAARLRKQQDENNLRQAPQKLDYTSFKKKMLDQTVNLLKK